MKNKFDFEAIKDYAIYIVLLAILFAMTFSCLMMIKTMDVMWYGATVILTIIGIVAGSLKIGGDVSEYEEEEQA